MPKYWLLAVVGPLSVLSLTACAPGVSNSNEEIADEIERSTDAAARLTAACSGCHSAQSGAIASLVGYSEAQMLDRLRTYRDEPDGTTVMHRLARGYSDEEIALISAYLGGREGE